VVLKKLSDVVNVVPVIAKSDSLTLEERAAFKERVRQFTSNTLFFFSLQVGRGSEGESQTKG
jgi:septin family protein